jgi:cytochrome c peroxidase
MNEHCCRLLWVTAGCLALLALSRLVAEAPPVANARGSAIPDSPVADAPGSAIPKPLPEFQHPADNPATPEKIALGKALFSDPRLSRTDQVSCASCHDPAKGFSNGERVATGVDGKKGTRSAPSLFNVAYSRFLFWDGRAKSLEEQALVPLQSPTEMDMRLDALEKKLNDLAEYRRQFQAVFAGEVTATRMAQAIAAYERTIVSRDTPFDRWLKGDKKALAPAAVRGMTLFYGQARCALCHKGPNLADDDFHNIGILDDGKQDPGRRGVTDKQADQGKFKTPTLREIGHTAPYMHNGRFKTLLEVVQHYNFGGVTDEANDYRDEQLRVLYLSEEQANDLVTFLMEGLTTQRGGKRK